MKKVVFSILTIVFTVLSNSCFNQGKTVKEQPDVKEITSEKLIFEDDFNTATSYSETLIDNATSQEYEKSLKKGYPLTKWNYSWTYEPKGNWKQAFFVVPPNEQYMTQAGRSGCNPGNYKITAFNKIPEDASYYRVEFKEYKNDNDEIIYILGGDKNGDNGIAMSYMNQIPGTDESVNDIYLRSPKKSDTPIKNLAFFREWKNVTFEVFVDSKRVKWKIGDNVIIDEIFENLKPGGYFGLFTCWDRGSRWDDFKIYAK